MVLDQEGGSSNLLSPTKKSMTYKNEEVDKKCGN
jgi:hypothetical protein